VIVVSPDILANNPELVAAQKMGLEIVSLAQLIQQLSQDQFRIVVIGSSLASLSIATAISSAKQSVDLICQQLINPSINQHEISAVHYTGQPQVVIDASLQPASVIDKASQVLYYQPHLLVVADNPDQTWSTADYKNLLHLLKDMKQLGSSRSTRL